MQPNRTYPIPLTWQQWRCLGHQDTYTDFQTYMTNIVGGLARLFQHTEPSVADTTTVENLRQAFVALTAGPGVVVPAAGLPPTVPMVAAATALLDGLLTAIANTLIDEASTENAQAKWSPLNQMVIRQLTDADLILASSNGAVGWQAAWANQPIPVSIMHAVMIQEIRVLCAFILCSDTVVGAVIRDDERGAGPALAPVAANQKRYAAQVAADGRPHGLVRTYACQNFGTMRSWHVDAPGYFTGRRSAAVDSDRRTAYQAYNTREFNLDQGIAVPIAEIPGNLKQGGHAVRQGLTEFNVLFGTNGRLIFDYDAGDFYLSGHYQEYPAPSEVLTQPERLANASALAPLTCYPYFKLTNLDQIRLDRNGFVEFARLCYWENARRARHRATIGK